MNYKITYDNHYINQIRKELRHYNQAFIRQSPSSTEHLIVEKNSTIIGYMKVSLSWNWVGINQIYYEDKNILSSMIQGVLTRYKGKAEGLRTFTEDASLMQDLLKTGFHKDGHLPSTTNTKTCHYLSHKGFDYVEDLSHGYDVKILQELTEEQEMKIDKLLDQTNPDEEEQSCTVVAFEDNFFAGGVVGYMSKDTMYIDLLIVKDTFRNKDVGRTLMDLLEEEAKKQGVEMISLGTTSFQAKGFYEKIGYQIIQTLDNRPKGHKAYTLYKML